MNPGSEQGAAVGIVGLLLLVAYGAHELGRRTRVPRVTLLLLIGVVVGPGGLHLVPEDLAQALPLVTQVSLSMVGFLLGERFLARKHRIPLKGLATLAAVETVVTSACVLLAAVLAGQPWPLALLLAAIAPASAPAATVDVVRESGARGPLTDTALAVVAIDDAYGIVLFSLLLALAQLLSGAGGIDTTVLAALWEVGGAIAFGALLGFPMAWLTGRLEGGEPTLIEALGFVLACGGLASYLGVSYLLACMTMGAIVATRAHHHSRPFHAIEGISDPFLVLFFLMAGFEFHLDSLLGLGAVAGLYVVGRVVGKIVGGYLGGAFTSAERDVRTNLGLCIMPQAGVALGLGLVAADRFPQWGAQLLSLLVGTTLVFEVAGPIAARVGFRRAGEIPPR